MEEYQTIHEGKGLKREGSVLFSWTKVDIVLKSHKLYLYKNEGERSLYPYVVIRLIDVIEVNQLDLFSITGKSNAIDIVSKNLKSKNDQVTIILCFETPEEQENWPTWILQQQSANQIQFNLVATAFKQRKENAQEAKLRRLTQNNEHSIVTESTDIFRVCSYNVNYGLCDLETDPTEEAQIVSALLQTNSHIVCLQESTVDWELYLKKQIGELFPYSLFRHHTEHSIQAGGVGILSTVDFTEISLILSPVGWFPAHLVKYHTSKGDVQILNLHLRPPLTENALPLPHAYFTSKRDRLTECKYYAEKLDKNLPIIVLGDFNEGEDAASVMFWKKEMNFQSALLNHIDPNCHTWWWTVSGVTVTARFDHIFYNDKLDADVVHEGVSDHYPVHATFKIEQDTQTNNNNNI